MFESFNCDTWCNKNLAHGILIEFFKLNLNQYLGM
jgi:hypothetical protein